jgi:hypothetical protein
MKGETFYLVATGEKQLNFRLTVLEVNLNPYTPGEIVSVSGQVEQISAWDENDDPADFEEYLSFYMKWDECCHINFGEDGNPGYLHLCGEHDWKLHSMLMSELFQWAKKYIPMRL